jgi:ribose/xylose/arabinose/galactoside ABC-type transport system permease subunit
MGGLMIVEKFNFQNNEFKITPPILIIGIIFLCSLSFLLVKSPEFFLLKNIINIFNQCAVLAILSLAMSAVMIGGGIDLSLPSNMALSAIFGSKIMIATNSILLGCVGMLVSGVLIGSLNGFAISKLRMIPFVVTLATMTICSGLSVWITNSVSIFNQPELFFDVFLSRPFGLPVSIFLLVIVVVMFQCLMSFTKFGWMVYAVGNNPEVSRISRVPVKRIIFITYVLAGFLAGVSAILITARLGSASANIGNDSVILDIVTACVVGGISIYGGKGRPIGAFLGAVLVIILGNILNLLGISFFLGLMAKGFLIIMFVSIDGFLVAKK